ncbi:MAG: glycosyl hydrolase 53 family protein, partial [Clostridia bacterium]|nr:glycosyl hydrolase 53 family protein [Clostridia bacterium]
MKKLIAILLAMSLCCGFSASISETAADGIYVEKVENLPDDFIFGMDASSVISLEDSGVKYYGYDSIEQDVFTTLAQSGVTHVRVRVWNDPYDHKGRGYGGGNCDIDKAIAIGKRVTANGMKLIVDFHYSDFWADPSKQMVPKAWSGMSIEEKTEAAYEFTKDCLLRLRDASVDVGMVQVGNETNSMLCGEKTWFNITYIMDAGSRATREIYPEALVGVHFTNPEKQGNLENYAKKLDYYELDYDVFCTSWYPYWHGSLDNLSAVLSFISETYGKKVMVMETSYAYTTEDSDFFGNTIGEGAEGSYPYTVQGQANLVRDLTDTIVNRTTGGIGICYWEGTWISVGGSSWEENHELWEKYGSGWATSFASYYDPNDAGQYYGGCAVDNQAMFDKNGVPLPSLQVFGLMKEGNEIEIKPDAIENSFLMLDINGDIVLPETVNAVMNDDSKQQVAVSWHADEAFIESLRKTGVGTYQISGEAGGMEALLYLTLIEFNFLSDWSFEEDDGSWTVTDLKSANELYIEDKKTDSLSGTKHLHFWSKLQNSVEFTAEQNIIDLRPGKYKYSISIMGGDCGDTD